MENDQVKVTKGFQNSKLTDHHLDHKRPYWKRRAEFAKSSMWHVPLIPELQKKMRRLTTTRT